ncbi:MAG: hypothetical protein PHX52_02585 [Candidatus Pacebacteria bacterium]|nr:hypothetical protein [Candidatus Paceibacterota bacterium]MDD3919447.1 hypothetical protein [Candidatus Paceibacterota bacterium]
MNKNFLIILIVVFLAVFVFFYINENKKTDEPTLVFEEIKGLDTKYISGATWPPEITISEASELVCNETASESSVSKRVYKQVVNNQEYCITASSEGAAGSVYTEYSYSTIKFSKLITLDFTLRFVNCYNYDGEDQAACIAERESFDVTNNIDEIISSLEYK